MGRASTKNLPLLFLIAARGGSRRIPGKNLRTVAGIPLVARAIRTARLAANLVPGGPHAVVCSTDDPVIAAVAADWGAEVPFLRPVELSDERAASGDVALHALDVLEAVGRVFRALVLVQPTSPLTEPGDLRDAVARFDGGRGRRAVVAVTPSHPASWHTELVERDIGALIMVAGSGEHLLSGAFYIVDPASLRLTRRFVLPGRTSGFEIPAERSVDIDEPADLTVAEAFAAARPCRTVDVAGRTIGDGPCFVIAEAGVNHDGDPERAHRLVDAAADAAADAVKFQTFDAAALAAADAPLAEYQRAAASVASGQREMLARLALPRDAWPALAAHARERGIVFLSSPFDAGSADLLEDVGVPAYKVPSGELTNHPFLALLAGKGRPLLVSTGMADIREVAAALDVIAAAGDPPVALFHCVSSYPAASADANLRAMGTLRAAFGIPTGWSDHTTGLEMPIAAVALGADLLEKHLTLDRSLPGPDHRASLEPGEFGAMVAGVRAVREALGSGVKVPTAAELETAAVARKSLHWGRDLDGGTVVRAEHLVALRPGTGLSPARLRDLVGRRLARAVTAGARAASVDVEADP